MASRIRAWISAASALALAACATPDGGPWPLTRAESSSYRETSTSEEVGTFLTTVAGRSGLLALGSAGRSREGRDLTLVIAADPPVSSLADAARDPRPKAVVMGNIHAGEVEGKEALQEIAREIACGGHSDIVRSLVLVILPDYNPDGNDAFDPSNRVDQNGPHCGVGRRSNADGLDLNRDFMKAEAPETHALLRLMRLVDPVLFIDCHTTDGCFHGFEVTYAPPLSPATDAGILDYERGRFLPALRRRMAEKGMNVFDYGNWHRGGGRKEWRTFDSRPRFSTNYVGLRNRLALLSEAYSYENFERRIQATRAFVLCALRQLVEDRDAAVLLCRQADARSAELGAMQGSLPAGARMAESGPAIIPESSVRSLEREDVSGVTLQDQNVHTWLRIPTRVHFQGLSEIPLPTGWVVARPDGRLLELLRLHGIRYRRLERPVVLDVRVFRVGRRLQATREFQGHRPTRLEGSTERRRETFPDGAVFIPSAQPLARLAFKLLEPSSDDGVAAWDLLRPVLEADGTWTFPVRGSYEDPNRAID